MINQFLRQPEGKTLDFNCDLSSQRNMLKTRVAFANAEGGRLLFDERPMPVLEKKSLQTLKLLRPEQGCVMPTHDAVLLYGKSREQHFPDTWVQYGRFGGLVKSAASSIRNSLITRVFRELELVEQRGSGIRRIFDEATRRGFAEPVIGDRNRCAATHWLSTAACG